MFYSFVFGICSLSFWVDLRCFKAMSGFEKQILSTRDFSFHLVERVCSRKQKYEYIFSMKMKNKNRTASVS